MTLRWFEGCAVGTLVVVCCWAGPVSPIAQAADNMAAPDALQAKVRVLTAPELAGRGAGSPETAVAADSLAAWFAAAGLDPAFDGSWFQDFSLSGEGWLGDDLSGRRGRNVGGTLPGAGSLAERWIVVGAHFDHLGRSVATPDGAATPAVGAYYPGANDNASGVAIVQELARLAAADRAGESRRGVLFVHFDAEEVGLQGAGHFVNTSPVPLDRIDAMLNLDTVGRLLDGRLFVSGIGTAPALATLVETANGGSLALSLAQGGWSGSDHMVFNTREIPVLFLFGGPYPEYNRPTDTADGLDYSAMARVNAFAARLLASLRRTVGGLEWVMVGDGGLRSGDDGPESEAAEQNRQTWLGTLPDFSEDTVGYPLAGVFDGSPAAQAGLQKGDVLVNMAGAELVDLATFTRALRSHDPGDVIEVTVQREGRLLRYTVVLGDRADRK